MRMKPTEIKQIGLFGGTFDPIHLGHLIIAETVRFKCQLDIIYFIPARRHALKDNRGISDATHRLQMVRWGIRGNPHFKASDLELRRTGVSYTVNTVRTFREKFPPPNHRLYFLIGSDAVNDLERWHEPEKLLQLCDFLVFQRANVAMQPPRQFAGKLRPVEVPALEISATEIRRRVSRSESIRYLVPAAVERYIHTNALYRRV